MPRGNRQDVGITWNRDYDVPDDGVSIKTSEVYGKTSAQNNNLLLNGDNLSAMNALIPEYQGRIDLIYIDPPYATGRLLEGRKRRRSRGEAACFDDRWDSLSSYLNMLAPRLVMMRSLLSPEGVIYVHVDWRVAHYVKILMDEIFGGTNFQNEIAWCYREAVNSKKRWNRKHDLIFFYSRSDNFKFNYREVLEPHAESTIKKYRRSDEKGPYRLMGRGLKGSPIKSARDVSPDWEKKHPELTFRHYLPEGKLPVDYWNIDIANQASAERTGYPTQKPIALIEKIIKASSSPGDIVADFFCGSGVTAEVAASSGRNWIVCDENPTAVRITRKRLLQNVESASFSVARLSSVNENNGRNIDFDIEMQRSEKARVKLKGTGSGSLDDVDFWAVDISYNSRPFAPDWWACAGKKKKVDTESPYISVENGKQKIAVLVTDVNGKQYFKTQRI